MTTHTFYIGMGSNAPDAEAQLATARQLLADRTCARLWFSTPVLTAPIDFPHPALFANQVALCEAAVEPSALRQLLKDIERTMGRLPWHKREGRVVIDLDLLSTDGRVCRRADWCRPYVRDGVSELEGQRRALAGYSACGAASGSDAGSDLGASGFSSSSATSSTPTNSSM